MPLHAGNIKIKIIATLMLLITGMLILNKAIYLHSHRMDTGVVITHSHPYNKSNDTQPYKSHFHSEAELVFLENTKLFYPVLILYLLFIFPVTVIKYIESKSINPEIIRMGCADYRAPPVS